MTKDARRVLRILFFALHVDIEKLFLEPAFMCMASSDLIHFSQPWSPVVGFLSIIMRVVAITKMYKQLTNGFSHNFTCILGYSGKTDFALT